MEGDVGGPEVGVAAGIWRRPGRAVGERGAGIAPHGAVGRCLQRHVGSCVGHDVGAARALEDGWVVDGGATRNRARAGILRAYTGRDGRDGQKAAEQPPPYRRHFQKRFEVARELPQRTQLRMACLSTWRELRPKRVYPRGKKRGSNLVRMVGRNRASLDAV